MYDKKVKWVYDTVDFLISIVRVLSTTRFRKTRKFERQHDRCIIMGNGPSLKPLLEKNANQLGNYDLIAVNYMGLHPEFMIYKPNIYVLCDWGFWRYKELPESVQVKKLYEFIAQNVTWQLQLYFPYQAKKTKEINEILSKNPNIRIGYYNMTKVEGYKWFQHMMVKRQWGMFRAENVVVASILLAMFSEYKQINLMGVDADWMKDVWVDEQNFIKIIDKHFYGNAEHTSAVKMHNAYLSLYYLFNSYYNIEQYSQQKQISIINLNPLSFVNVFKKQNLS